MTWWWPRSGLALAVWLLIGVVVSTVVGAKLLLEGLGHVLKLLPIFDECECSEPAAGWYLSPVLHTAALCLVPFVVMAAYQGVVTVWLNWGRLRVWARLLWTGVAIVGGLGLWWLLLGALVNLLM